MSFKLGRLPNDPSKPRIRLAAHLRAGASPPPSATYDAVPAWGMLGNSEWGDCTCAGDGHIAELLSFYGQGTEAVVTDAEALAAYSAISGFDPNAGPSGDNPTDRGASVQDALGYLRTTGMSGVKIDAFAEVEPGDINAIQVAAAQFGCLSAGVNLPANAQQQFTDGQPWDAVPDDGGIEGGHCIILCGYDQDFLYFATWGQVQKATYAWWAKYGEEIWAVVSADWVSAQGTDPEGVNLTSLGVEFATLTGEPNPFNGTHAPSPEGLLAKLAAEIRAAVAEYRPVADLLHWLEEHGL